jgi:predicted aspartyl protease
VIRYRYNTQLQPPAPFVYIQLRNPGDGNQLANVPAQIDTAADRTVLPQSLVKALDLAQIGTMRIGGLGGITYELPTYVVYAGIHDFAMQPVKIVASAEEHWILLGRDVLNAIRFVLDGPHGVLEVG